MAAPGVGGIVSIVWVLMLFGPRLELATAAESHTIELRLGARGGLDDAALHRVEETVGSLLAPAGIGANWHGCQPPDGCRSERPVIVLVQLLTVSKMTDGEVCGEFLRDQRSGVPTVLVYLPRVVELQQAMRGGSGARNSPALATTQIGDLIGLIVAHEVGHALGLPHGRTGVMKARPSVDDVVALRLSTLAFQQKEAAVMRLALIARSEELLAQAR
jgi:hypothetical protein